MSLKKQNPQSRNYVFTVKRYSKVYLHLFHFCLKVTVENLHQCKRLVDLAQGVVQLREHGGEGDFGETRESC